MQSRKSLTMFPILSLLLLGASACEPRERIRPLFPPVADVKAATEAKPVAPPEIVTSAQANARYNIEVEAWGERVSRAGGRICRWVTDNGGELPFECPKAPTR
jgi:hypothetical protein